MDEDENGFYRIYDGRVVQARVIAVAEKAIRIEAFGVNAPSWRVICLGLDR